MIDPFKRSKVSAYYAFIFIYFIQIASLYSEAFGNNAIVIPKIGVVFLDDPIILHKKPWGIGHQWYIGTTFFQALNYRFFFAAESGVGFGSLNRPDAPNLSSFFGGAGIRMNMLEHDIRPYLSVMVHYLHFLGQNAKNLPLSLGWPVFVGLKPGAGLEWLVLSEMGILIETAYGLYFNLNEPLRQIFYANAAFSLYF